MSVDACTIIVNLLDGSSVIRDTVALRAKVFDVTEDLVSTSIRVEGRRSLVTRTRRQHNVT